MAKDKSTCASSGSCSQESCEGCSGGQQDKKSLLEDFNAASSVKRVIGVVSGKGGVGKSFVTAALASAMSKKGYEVGIMDADITGPSIPKMYGMKGPLDGNELGIFPGKSKDNVKVVSVNLLINNEESPVLWRGPVISGIVTQFWKDVYWGDLDYMFVDMPPGTGDVALTVFQSLPVDSIVIVTSPQDLVQMIVKKAYNMAKIMDIPVLGIVENYSYITCPDCGRQINLFGESKIEAAAAEIGVPVLGRIPLDPEYAQIVDGGHFDQVEVPYLENALRALENVPKKIWE